MRTHNLLLMALFHFILMYVLMFAMVNQTDYLLPNMNQFYMAAIMTTPMLLLETTFMGKMFENAQLLKVIVGVSIGLFIIFFYFIREQVGITDKEFLRSMIPHHSSAILMCSRSSLKDPELKDLCATIISTQQQEINIMVDKLEELNN